MSEEKTVNKRFFERSPTNASETSRDLRRRWLAIIEQSRVEEFTLQRGGEDCSAAVAQRETKCESIRAIARAAMQYTVVVSTLARSD